MAEKIYPVAKRLVDTNKHRRVISFDTGIGGGHVQFLETHRVDDLKMEKHKLYLYPRDVWEDGKRGWFGRQSETLQIRNSQIEAAVRKNFYIEANAWSRLPYSIILPPTPSRLPPFMLQPTNVVEKLFGAMFIGAIKGINLQTSIISSLEEQGKRKDEFMQGIDQTSQIENISQILGYVKAILKDEIAPEKPAYQQQPQPRPIA